MTFQESFEMTNMLDLMRLLSKQLKLTAE